MELLRRHPENPILIPRADVPWEKEAVFNPGVTVHQGKIYMLYRAIGEYEVYSSSLGLAISEDGIHFQRFPEPVFSPAEPYDRYGCEDPRITRLDGRFYITYTALSQRAFSGRGNRVALASTEDFRDFRRHGVILPDLDDKDTVIFPEKVRGRYVMYHRVPPDIWIAYSDDLVNWYGHRRIMFPRPGLWDSQKIGAGAPPIRTDAGWLLVYHGVDRNRVYRLGVALFDLDDPSRLISRPLEPILEPREWYEKEGDVPNVVFTCGLAEVGEEVFVYYGGGDKVIGLATVGKRELLDFARRG